jgi:hypothetical protein
VIHSANMPSMVEPEPLTSVGQQTKPCGCGRPGCVAVRREREDSADWRDRKYRSRSCGTWKKNQSPEMQAARSKGGIASTGNRRDGTNREPGALVTHPIWLDRPSGRIAAQRAAHGISVP